MSIRAHRNGQPRTRSAVAIDAFSRRAERDMGNKQGKGRTRREQADRQTVKHALRSGGYDA